MNSERFSDEGVPPLKKQRKEEDLLSAVIDGSLERVMLHLENGKSVDERYDEGNTCLLLASAYGHLELVKYFVDNGSAINETNDFGETCFLLL